MFVEDEAVLHSLACNIILAVKERLQILHTITVDGLIERLYHKLVLFHILILKYPFGDEFDLVLLTAFENLSKKRYLIKSHGNLGMLLEK